MAVTFQIDVTDSASPKIRRVGDAFGGLGKEQKKTTSTGMKLAAAVTAINQGLELAKKVLGAVNKAWKTFQKYTTDIAKEQAKLIDNLAKTSRGLGMQAQELQAIRSAWQMAGVEVTQTDRALLNIQKQLLDADRGLSTSVELFEMAGVEIRKTNGEMKTGSEVTREISRNIKDGLVPAQQQAALSAQLFRDRSGAVLNALKAGDEAIVQATDRLERYGAAMSGELLAASEAYVDSTQRLKEAQDGLKNSIAKGTLPTMTALNNALAEFIGKQKLARDGLESGLGALFPKLVYLGIRLGEGIAQLGIKFGYLEINAQVAGAKIKGHFIDMALAILETFKKVADKLGIGGFFGDLDGLINDFKVQALDSAAVLNDFEVQTDQLMKKSLRTTDDAIGLWGSFLDQLNAVQKQAVSTAAALDGASTAANGGEAGGFLTEVPTGTAYAGGAQDTAKNPHEVTWDAATGAVERYEGAVFEAQQTISTGWNSVAESVGHMSASIATAEDRGEALKQGMKSVFSAIITKVGEFAQAAISANAATTASSVASSEAQFAASMPAAITESIQSRGASVAIASAAVAAGVAGMTALFSAIGDAGIMPGMLTGRSTVLLRDDETVVDPQGSRGLNRMFNWFERNITRSGFSDARNVGAGGGAGPMVFQVNLDGRTIAEVTGDSMFDLAQSGQGRFRREAFA